MKSLDYCLDYILDELIKNWDVGSADQRKHLQCEEILRQFDLPPYYLKHEFFRGLIDKLVKDGYAEFIDPDELSSGQKERMTFYQQNAIVTIVGFYFRKQKRGYQGEAKRRWWVDLPKNYWWALAIFTFFVGLFTDPLKDLLKQKISQPSIQQPKLPTSVDTLQNHKTVPHS